MAFAFALDPTIPAGGEAASLGDDRIREFKNAMIERLESFFSDADNDPLQVKTGATFLGTATFGGLLTVSAGGLTVSAGTTAVQALTATTGVFSSTVTIQGTASLTSGTTVVGSAALAGTASLIVAATAGQIRQLILRSGSTDRWALIATATAESGGDAGSNCTLTAYTDAGAVIDSPINIIRAAGGTMALARPVTMSSTLALTAATSRLGISGTQANVLLNVTGSGLAGEGVTQYGLAVQSTPGSDATTQYAAIFARARSAAAVYTLTNAQAVFIPTPSLGAGSTVTNLYGLFVDTQSGGGSNYAIYTNGGLVRLGDAVTMTSTLAVTGAITGSSTIAGTTITASTAFAGPGTIATAGSVRLASNTSIFWRNAANSGNIGLTLGGDDVFTLQASMRLGSGDFPDAGRVRLTNNQSVAWRNAANSANLTLSVSASDIFTFAGGGLTVSSGTTTVQALSATTGIFSSTVTAAALLTGAGTLASAGEIRLPHLGNINWRNAGNTGNLGIELDNDRFEFEAGIVIAGVGGLEVNGGPLIHEIITLPYDASIDIDASFGSLFYLEVTNNTPFTMNKPTNPTDGQKITIIFRNTSGGASGTITWAAGWVGGTAPTSLITNALSWRDYFYHAATDEWYSARSDLTHSPAP